MTKTLHEQAGREEESENQHSVKSGSFSDPGISESSTPVISSDGAAPLFPRFPFRKGVATGGAIAPGFLFLVEGARRRAVGIAGVSAASIAFEEGFLTLERFRMGAIFRVSVGAM